MSFQISNRSPEPAKSIRVDFYCEDTTGKQFSGGYGIVRDLASRQTRKVSFKVPAKAAKIRVLVTDVD